MSKCDKNKQVAHTVICSECVTDALLSLIYNWTDTWQHGIYLQSGVHIVTLARKIIFPLDEVCMYMYHNIIEYTILDKNLINFAWLYYGQVSMKGAVQCGHPE